MDTAIIMRKDRWGFQTSQTEIKCQVCEEGTLISSVERVAVEYNGVSGEVDSYYLYCDVCGVHSGVEEIRKSKRNVIEFRKQALGLLTGKQVRDIRVKLRLNQSEAAKLFGGGPVAFSKYENDDIIQSESMDKLLRVAAHSPEHVLPVLTNAYKSQGKNTVRPPTTRKKSVKHAKANQ